MPDAAGTRVTPKLRVLFLCTGNSCRSQMAEAWARHLKGEVIDASSAGMHPKGLDPLAVQVMAEVGIDLSTHQVKSLDAMQYQPFDVQRRKGCESAGLVLACRLCRGVRDGCARVGDFSPDQPAEPCGPDR